jgi:magnesium chelatase subunit D
MLSLPLTGLVGFDAPRLALLLLAVDPGLRGLVLVGAAGTGKTALMRGLRELLPDVRWHEMPPSVDDEALLGGLDLEATLARGRRVVRPGLLQRAHGGLLAVDSCNLLSESAVHQLARALDERSVRIERDGISAVVPADFSVVANYDPAEGAPRAHLLDRIGMLVRLPEVAGHAARAEIVRRHLHPALERWQQDLDLQRQLLAAARASLPAVRCSDALLGELVQAASALGVQGHRAEQFALRVARASAALALRDAVEREDVELAVRIAIAPRATRMPPAQQPDEAPTEAPPEPQPEAQQQHPPEPDAQSGDDLEVQEEILEAMATELPPLLDALPFQRARRGRAGSRGAAAGTRGRHIGSVPGEPRGQRIDVLATLRAAARWQRLRPRRRNRVEIRAEDIRVKRFRSKAGTLFIFAVDASGSMALNRMRQAKGAVHALLAQAYVNRDKVALLSFRGEAAELLLPPTGSVELLRRAVDQIPTGGGTPLAAALMLAQSVGERARRQGMPNIVLLLLTDARANVALRGDRAGIDSELKLLSATVARAGWHSLVIDTQRNFLSQGRAQQLSQWLGGRYLYLPGASGAAIASAARDA